MMAKKITGVKRLYAATLNSRNGFVHIWKSEAAFRQELVTAVLLMPLVPIVARSLVEAVVLVGVWVLVLVTELLNTAVELAIDRIGLEQHPLSGLAKDLGSAAVLTALTLAVGSWLAFALRWLMLGA
jgi:diacylglycerol kinase (ATP)